MESPIAREYSPCPEAKHEEIVALARFMCVTRNESVPDGGARTEIEVRGDAERATHEQNGERLRDASRITPECPPPLHTENDENERRDDARGPREDAIAPRHRRLPVHVRRDIAKLDPERYTARPERGDAVLPAADDIRQRRKRRGITLIDWRVEPRAHQQDEKRRRSDSHEKQRQRRRENGPCRTASQRQRAENGKHAGGNQK